MPNTSKINFPYGFKFGLCKTLSSVTSYIHITVSIVSIKENFMLNQHITASIVDPHELS